MLLKTVAEVMMVEVLGHGRMAKVKKHEKKRKEKGLRRVIRIHRDCS